MPTDNQHNGFCNKVQQLFAWGQSKAIVESYTFTYTDAEGKSFTRSGSTKEVKVP